MVAMHCVSPIMHGWIVKADQPSKSLTLVVCHSRSLHGLTVNSELRAMVMAVQQVLAECIAIFSNVLSNTAHLPTVERITNQCPHPRSN